MNELIMSMTRDEALGKIATLRGMLSEYDYIGTKIAMGVATRDEYADKIAQTVEWRSLLNEIEAALPEIARREMMELDR